VFYSLPPVARKRSVRHSVSVPRFPDQWSLSSQVEISKFTAEENILAVQLEQGSIVRMEEMMR